MAFRVEMCDNGVLVATNRKNAMKRFSWLLPSLILILLLGTVASSRAEEVVEPVEYVKEIKLLLKARCYPCHGGLKQEAGLRLDTGKLIRQGSRNGQVLQPGQADGALIERIRSIDHSQRMPPEGESPYGCSRGQLHPTMNFLNATRDFTGRFSRLFVPRSPRLPIPAGLETQSMRLSRMSINFTS